MKMEPRIYAILIVLMATEILCSLEVSMIYTALPAISRQFPDLPKVGWLLTAFMLVQAGAAAIGGKLGDLYGRRRVLIILVTLCGFGSLLSALTNSLTFMIAGRAIQGLSGAILPLCYAIARDSVPRERLPFWIGCLTGAYTASTGIGYLLGGVLVDHGSWHLLFYFTTGYAVLLIIPIRWVLPAKPGAGVGAGGRGDILGGLLFVPAVASFLIGVSSGNQWGWTSMATLTFIGAGIGLLSFWAWYEGRHKNPLVDVRLLLKREVAIANIALSFAGFGVFFVSFLMLLLLQQPVATGIGLGISASLAGVFKLPSNVVSAIASPFGGFVYGRFGARAAIVSAGLIGTSSALFLMLSHDSIGAVVFASILATSACAMILAAVPNVMLQAVPAERSGEATGLSSAMLGMATATGIQAITFILSLWRVSGEIAPQTFPTAHAYLWCFLFVAITSSGMTVAGLFLRGRKSTRETKTTPALL